MVGSHVLLHPGVLVCFMALLPPSRVLLLAVVAVCWSQVVIWVKGAAVWELEQSPLHHPAKPMGQSSLLQKSWGCWLTEQFGPSTGEGDWRVSTLKHLESQLDDS